MTTFSLTSSISSMSMPMPSISSIAMPTIGPDKKMLRSCTDIETFVMNHGVEEYQKLFCPHMSIDTLLTDPIISSNNDNYERLFGPGITEYHICKYIEYWGVDQYKEWCARDRSYESIISNDRIALAQQVFLEKTYGRSVIQPKLFNPYEKEFRDHKGNAVPAPNPFECDENLDMVDSISLYIRNNGIINYMLKVTSKYTLEELLSFRDVAQCQRHYIRQLEYENKLI